MKIPLLTNKNECLSGSKIVLGLLTIALMMLKSMPSIAEGSKDFVDYDGYRMFLDTRDPQQLKVYAKAGETLNIGSSHVGIQGGFIEVYDPEGNLVVTYNNTGASTGLAIINNNIEEMAGPTGGGTVGGNGYVPGTISVTTSTEGVWTVLFDYPSYQNTAFTNILNDAPWTRAANQPNSRRVVLAWDITVTQGGAGNTGGTPLEGRVYSNEHISLLNQNNFNTSPIFYVLTRDGFLYQVNINEADPFRFPISSNSLGLVDGNINPIFKSKPEADFTRSDDPNAWDPNELYLYEPQAEDFGPIINNKIFFNIPNPDLPMTAPVTDVFRDNFHETWLLDSLEILVIDSLYFSTTPCNNGIIEFQKGGTFVFETNLDGFATIQLDLNNNGVYTDSVDVTITGPITAGTSTLFWDGTDGFGNPISVQDAFTFSYQGKIRFGELHIALTDVEGSDGGVTFEWLNAPTGFPTDQFYYDHTDIGGPVSGGGTPGNALPTNQPYTYPLFEGDEKYIDQWFFIEQIIDPTTLTVDVVGDCDCQPAETPQIIAAQVPNVCEGDALSLTVENNNTSGIGDITYEWTGPDGFDFTVTLDEFTPSTVLISDMITLAASGDYQVIASTTTGCADTLVISVEVSPFPELTTDQDNFSLCSGQNIDLCATNITPGIGTMICTWTGPNLTSQQQTVNGDDEICVSLTGVTSANAGNYTLICVYNGCESEPLTINVDVNPQPVISAISPNGTFCAGQDIELTASNTTPGVAPVSYTWTGPNNFTFSDVSQSDVGPFSATLADIQVADAGTYTLVITSADGCTSVAQSVNINVNPTPVICNVSGGGSACIGQDVILSGSNCTSGLTFPVTYTWINENTGNELCSEMASNDGPYTCTITNAQLTDSGNYTLIVEDDNGCESEPFTVTLEVVPGLNIIDPTPDSTYCEGSTVVLTAANDVNAGIISYTWTGPNGILCGPIDVNFDEPLTCEINGITAMDAGTYTLTVTSLIGCVSTPLSVEVDVFPTFMVDQVSGGGEYCELEPIVLSGSGSGTATLVDYEWQSPGGESVGSGTGLGPAGPFEGQDNTPEEGTYTLTVTTSDGCTDVETVEVTLSCTPVPQILLSDTVLCDLDTLTFCAQNINADCPSFDYTWTTPNGTTITGSASGTDPFCEELLPLVDFGAGYYTLTLTSQGCTSITDSVLVELNPNPAISSFTGGGTYCLGDTATVCFSNTNPAVTEWFWTCIYAGQQVTGTGTGTDEVCLDITEPGFIFCSLESVDGCVSSLDGTELIFDTGFDLDVDVTTPICADETLMLNGSNNSQCTGTVDYEWTGPNGFTFSGTAPCTGPFPTDVTDPVSGEYCLIVQSNNSICSDTACVDVVVNPVPFVVGGVINGGGEFCEGDTTVLTAVIDKDGGGDINYVWTQDGTPVASGTAASGSTVSLDLAALDLDEAGNYCLELTCVATECTSDGNDCTEVIVNETPNITEILGDGTYCEGFDVMLTGSGDPCTGTVTYTWTGPNFSFSGSAPCGGPYPATVNNIQVNQGGVYTLVVTKGDCQSEEASIVVNVNPTPDIINVSAGDVVCEGDVTTIVFTIDPDGATSVDWEIAGPELNESGTVTELTEFMFDVVVTQSGTYVITATSDQGCEAEPQNVSIEVQPIPVPAITASTDILCPGDPLQLTTDEVADAIYTWYKDGEVIGTTEDPIFDVVPSMSGDYQVEITIGNCTEISEAVIVTSPPTPNAVDDTFGGLVTDPEITGNVLANDSGGDLILTVLTQPEQGTVTVDSAGNLIYIPNGAGNFTFVYEICSVECPELCDEATVTLAIENVDCIVPNVITPNGDGVNDILVIDCLEGTPPDSRLEIFNRWGDEIRIFEPYDNSWDGTNDSDEPLPAGTYFFLFWEDKNTGDPVSGFIKLAP